MAFSNGAQVWGLIAGMALAVGLISEMRGTLRPVEKLDYTDRLVAAGLSLFLLLMGSILPAIAWVPAFGYTLFPYVSVFAWWGLASCAWALNVRYYGRTKKMLFSAWGTFAMAMTTSFYMRFL